MTQDPIRLADVIERVKKLEDQIDIWKRTAPLTDKEGRPNLVRSFLDIEKRVEKLEQD